jgi:DoxX-like family
MSQPTVASSESRRVWIGRAITALPVLFLLVDGGAKLFPMAKVAEANAKLGWPEVLVPEMGALELLCLALYVYPHTAILGAVLLTGFLGGGVALHLRVGDPLLTHCLFPVYIGLLIWGGLYLRDGRLRSLLPWRT